MKQLVSAIESELRDLFTYFGEDPAATKPEDFFGLVVSFASSVHVCLALIRLKNALIMIAASRLGDSRG